MEATMAPTKLREVAVGRVRAREGMAPFYGWPRAFSAKQIGREGGARTLAGVCGRGQWMARQGPVVAHADAFHAAGTRFPRHVVLELCAASEGAASVGADQRGGFGHRGRWGATQ